MQGLLLGIDLCDDYSQVSCMNPLDMTTEAITLSSDESSCLIPTVICKKRGEDEWFGGEEAYRRALFNEGTMVDKLVKLARKDGSATIEGVKYSAEELLYRFVEMLITMARQKYQLEEIDSLVFTVQTLEGDLLDLLVRVAERCGVPRELVHILNHTESFVYYVISQKQEVWANISCMFDLTEDGLHYYEMKMIRGRNPRIVEAAHERMEESFSLDLLDNASGEHLGDTILTACAERLLSRKIISSVFLTGRGFAKTDWLKNFLPVVCRKRKVFAGQHIFASGAAYVAYDVLQETSSYPFICLCEGRLQSSVCVSAVYAERNEKVMLASAGTNWYEARSRVELIPDNMDYLELNIISARIPRADKIKIDLTEFPVRPNKTTKIEVIVSFVSEDCMTVRIIDRGFGDLFPASGKMIRKDFYLS